MLLLCHTLLLFSFVLTAIAGSEGSTPVRAVARSKYTSPHSLGQGYNFSSADGWQHVKASSAYHRALDERSLIEKREPKSLSVAEIIESTTKNGHTTGKKTTTVKSSGAKPKSKTETWGNSAQKGKNQSAPNQTGEKKSPDGFNVVGVIKGVASDVWRGLKGLGKKEDVKITWYTGQDLQHPSCWSNSPWAPTDKSFAAALTIEGWENKPECFRFLELCNGAERCIFARVVDTCAGCRNKHVDLTRAAFGALADFGTGMLTAQLRLATEPEEWYEDLWGPKAPIKRTN